MLAENSCPLLHLLEAAHQPVSYVPVRADRFEQFTINVILLRFAAEARTLKIVNRRVQVAGGHGI
jgi:hypothetical protein